MVVLILVLKNNNMNNLINSMPCKPYGILLDFCRFPGLRSHNFNNFQKPKGKQAFSDQVFIPSKVVIHIREIRTSTIRIVRVSQNRT